MRKLLFQSFFRDPLTEQAPAHEMAGALPAATRWSEGSRKSFPSIFIFRAVRHRPLRFYRDFFPCSIERQRAPLPLEALETTSAIPSRLDRGVGSGNPLFENHAIHRVRSKVRSSDGLDGFMLFIFGFVTCSLRRTPRPPAELVTPGLINSIPAFSSAETSFIRESTFPRITPSLASMRWMVGTERSARSAVCR